MGIGSRLQSDDPKKESAGDAATTTLGQSPNGVQSPMLTSPVYCKGVSRLLHCCDPGFAPPSSRRASNSLTIGQPFLRRMAKQRGVSPTPAIGSVRVSPPRLPRGLERAASRHSHLHPRLVRSLDNNCQVAFLFPSRQQGALLYCHAIGCRLRRNVGKSASKAASPSRASVLFTVVPQELSQ